MTVALVAGAAVCAGYVVLGALAYVALLAVSLGTGADAGGPLGGPLLLLLGALTGLACVLVVWTTTALGAVLARAVRLPGPVVSAGLVVLAVVALALVDVARDVVPGVSPPLVGLVTLAALAPAWAGLTAADRAAAAGASWLDRRRERRRAEHNLGAATGPDHGAQVVLGEARAAN